MLTLIESRKEKREASDELRARLESAWRARETRIVTWRPGSQRMSIHHNEKYWYKSSLISPDKGIRRYSHSFGPYRDNGNLQISVEFNVPTDANSRKVSGFFARDSQTGATYLMHDGGVGGGKAGVGRKAFLAFSDCKLVSVADLQGDTRLGIIVTPIDSVRSAANIARFIEMVVSFKNAVRKGETTTPQARAAQRRYGDYYDEFSGRKRRQRVKELEYVSRHGDIVRALRSWRMQSMAPHERVFKDVFADLGVRVKGDTCEIYEVKTSCDRQSLYAAIGQIIVHDDSSNQTCKRFLVLPDDGLIPDDINRALVRSRIALIRFVFQGDAVQIRPPQQS
ncbi:hypothetical protein [Pelagibius sp. 7325]|uniref:hypothetical protein n=1 Tax=Pelagibius sp. 7325 TaxID=3131994 RepID=UPI0030EB26CD